MSTALDVERPEVSAQVVFHRLDRRADGDEWIVGRVDIGAFIAVPREGMRAIELLESGLTIEETQHRLRLASGRALNIGSFVHALARLGLVASIAGRGVPSPEPMAPTFPSLRTAHVRWLLHPLLHCLLGLLIMAGAVVAVRDPRFLPTGATLVWGDHGTLVLLTYTALSWLLLLVHELAHLLTARGAGAPGRIRLGTRLNFLVAETEVSGVWLRSRRIRMTVYLAGMVLDAAIVSACLLVMAVKGSDVLLLQLVVVIKAVSMSTQFMVHMRTDVYFVVQDLSGCRNMYGDACAYLRHLYMRPFHPQAPSPLSSLSARERRFLKGYAVLLAAGTVGSVFLAVALYRWFTVPLADAALQNLASGQWQRVADGVVTMGTLVGVQMLWARSWWRRHGARVRRFASKWTLRSR